MGLAFSSKPAYVQAVLFSALSLFCSIPLFVRSPFDPRSISVIPSQLQLRSYSSPGSLLRSNPHEVRQDWADR